MILAPLYLFSRNKRKGLSKALISEVEYTKYNKSFTTDDFSKEEIAHLVAEIVTEEYEKVLIERWVKTNYDFMEDYERAEVIKEACLVAKTFFEDDIPSLSERKAFISKKVLNYLEDNNSIVPCGFVDFRLREVYFWIEAICKKGADIYFDKRECEEFTYLLSMFVKNREEKEKVIHVVWEKGVAKLFNKRGRSVTAKYQKDFLNKAREDSLSKDDLAISAVIAASPGRLILHMPPASPLTEALTKIFSDRCRICHGCNFCKKC